MNKKRGGRSSISKDSWLQYVGLSVLAVAAIGVTFLALNQEAPKTATSHTAAAITPTATPAPTATSLKIKLPADPSVLIVGDSYTEGVGAGKGRGWAQVAGTALGLKPQIDGVAGTGFAWGGGADNSEGRQFSVRLGEIAAKQPAAPDVLILQGGQNDKLLKDDPEVSHAVVSTVGEARKLWPNVQVLIMGPSAPEPLAAILADTNAAVRAGAATVGVPFIDADGENWFSTENSASYYFDGSHVNNEGHQLIADRFAEHWLELTT